MLLRFGTEKNEDTALKCYEGMANRRAWDAFAFPIHPAHDSDRMRVNLDRVFTVIVLVGGSK